LYDASHSIGYYNIEGTSRRIHIVIIPSQTNVYWHHQQRATGRE